MQVKLLKQSGPHAPGTVHDVVEVIEHGGYSDDPRQYRLPCGVVVRSGIVEVLPAATTMIERVARAIAKADATSSYEELARAAIEAMREPTEAMVDAAEWAEPDYHEDDMDVGGTFKAEWRAAIDSALNEQVSA